MRSGERRLELGLLLLAVLIVTVAYVLASLGRSATIPSTLAPFLAVVLGLLAAAHIALRRLAPAASGLLLPVAALLNGIGYVFIVRLDNHLAGLQALWTALGIAAFIGTLVVVRHCRDLERFQYTLGLVGVMLLVLPLAPGIGQNINGARLWLRLGGVSFQPVELAKIALAVFFAAYLIEHAEMLTVGTRRLGPLRLPEPRALAPVVGVWAASLLVMTAERDIGFSLLLFSVFVALLWVTTGRKGYLASGAILFVFGATVAWRLFPHVQDRVRIWLNPWPVASGKGFQLIQALFAMGSGGIAGAGIGLGSPTRIPVVATDFIFAAIGEELGLFGTVFLVVAYLVIIAVGLHIAVRSDRPFDKLLATALTTTIGLQAFYIMAGVTRLLPLTGITLPFVSYGGSSLIANYILLALLLRVSDDQRPLGALDHQSRGGGMSSPAA